MISLLLPGVAITYYGEEIGMQDVTLTWEQTIDPAGRNAGPDRFTKHSRDPQRSPMQWNNETNAGEYEMYLQVKYCFRQYAKSFI
jgi:alpha-glucosidase